ncbi:MAG: hypothetical protein ACJ79H_03485 [Myxococcales bacterium]
MARLTPEQAKLASQAHYGLIRRPPRSVLPAITVRDYAYIVARWKNFDPWRSWKDAQALAGHPIPRPEGVWRAVPKWDGGYYTPFDLLADIRAAHPLPPNAQPAPLPVPAPGSPLNLAVGQCWFVIAQDYWEAVSGPNYFGRAYTADHGYPHPSREDVAALKSRGIRTATWGDSRVEGDGTSPTAICALADELKVGTPMFQAELPREYVAATKYMDDHGLSGIPLILNRSAIQADGGKTMYDDLVARIHRGNVYGISECYKNCGWGDPDWGGEPMASTLGATYHDGQCEGATQDFYYSRGLIVPHRDSWYTAQWTAAMYAVAR